MINFFIIEVEENFSMDKIDSIFHVNYYLLRRWAKKALFLTIFGYQSSTKPNNMLTSQV